MYRNVKAEMVRQGITQEDLADKLGITRATMSLKLNKKAKFTLEEAFEIQKVLRTRLSIDALFVEDSI